MSAEEKAEYNEMGHAGTLVHKTGGLEYYGSLSYHRNRPPHPAHTGQNPSAHKGQARALYLVSGWWKRVWSYHT